MWLPLRHEHVHVISGTCLRTLGSWTRVVSRDGFLPPGVKFIFRSPRTPLPRYSASINLQREYSIKLRISAKVVASIRKFVRIVKRRRNGELCLEVSMALF